MCSCLPCACLRLTLPATLRRTGSPGSGGGIAMPAELFRTLTVLVALWCGLGLLLGILAVMTKRGSGVVLIISSALLFLTLAATEGEAILPVVIFLPLMLAITSR